MVFFVNYGSGAHHRNLYSYSLQKATLLRFSVILTLFVIVFVFVAVIVAVLVDVVVKVIVLLGRDLLVHQS